MNVGLALPEGWVDRTVLTYVGPDRGAGSPSIVVTHEELSGDVSLARYAAMQDAAVRAGLEGVDRLDDRETTVAGRPAVCQTYRWTLDGRTMRQRLWCLVERESGVTVVASAADAEFDGLRPVFSAALASIALGS